MTIREELEKTELKVLSPQACFSARSQGRVRPEAPHVLRTDFQRDRDRIIHSKSFRRLKHKTQVFLSPFGDHYRTRLTHCLEVSQIARTIAKALRLNEDLTEAIALGHDLGHTPFGHAGEAALQDLMAAHGGFEHNRQSLRLVDLLEERYPAFPGLNLTYEVREGLAKHRTTHDRPPPDDDLAREFPLALAPSLEAQAINAADAVAYDNHDLDDGLSAGIIAEADLKGIALWREAAKAGGGPRRARRLEPKLRRRQAIHQLINLMVSDLIENSARLIEAQGVRSLAGVRRHGEPLVRFSAAVEARRRELEDFLRENFYEHFRIKRMAQKARMFVEALFQEYLRHPRLLPSEHQALIRPEDLGPPRAGRRSAPGPGETLQRAVADYIAGMTDSFAQQEYKRLFFPFERV